MTDDGHPEKAQTSAIRAPVTGKPVVARGRLESSPDRSRYRIASPAEFDSHFSALLELHNTEVQTIWNRFNALLTANSVVGAVLAAFIARPITKASDTIPMLAGSLVGLIFSKLWWNLTRDGWDVSREWCTEIGKFAEANGRHDPFACFHGWHKRTGVASSKDPIRRTAEWVIRVFLANYTIALGYYSWKFILLTPSPF